MLHFDFKNKKLDITLLVVLLKITTGFDILRKTFQTTQHFHVSRILHTNQTYLTHCISNMICKKNCKLIFFNPRIYPFVSKYIFFNSTRIIIAMDISARYICTENMHFSIYYKVITFIFLFGNKTMFFLHWSVTKTVFI